MGKTILTSTQHNFLELARDKWEITNWFTLVGGTALSEFYLKHRLSEDLDFFSESPINESEVENIILEFVHKYNADGFDKRTHMGVFIYQIKFPDKTSLKVDFNHFVFSQLESGTKFKDLKIASLWDIVIDKFYTILGNPRARDYIDLYFGIKEVGCNLEQLLNALREKYEFKIENTYLLRQFTRVTDFSDFPKMLIPFNREKMENFYLKLAKDLESKIFK